MSHELECAYEDLNRVEAQRDLAWKLVLQYRAEIRSRHDLMAEGFCQGAWFNDLYDALARSIIDDTLPKVPTPEDR